MGGGAPQHGSVNNQHRQEEQLQDTSVVGVNAPGPPVEKEVAIGFLRAAYAEYVQGAPGGVEKYYDSINASDELQDILDPLEDRTADGNDTLASIRSLATQWRIPPES